MTKPPVRRRPGEAAAVTREQIIDAADAIARAEGLDKVSIRRISGDLSVTPAALYWHVENKQHVLTGILDRAFARIERPQPNAGTWLDRVLSFYASQRDVLVEYRGIGIAVTSLPPTESALACYHYVFEQLVDGGFRQDDAVSLFIALSTFGQGHLMIVDAARLAQAEQSAAPGGAPVVPFIADRPDFAPFLNALANWDDDRSRKQYLTGVDLLVRGAAAAAGVTVPAAAG